MRTSMAMALMRMGTCLGEMRRDVLLRSRGKRRCGSSCAFFVDDRYNAKPCASFTFPASKANSDLSNTTR